MFTRKKIRPSTVDAAIAPLLQAITDLDGVAESRTEAIARDSEEVSMLQLRMQIDSGERIRAEAVAKAIRAITDPAVTGETEL